MPEAKTRFRLTVLAHDFPFEHWDLLLETPGELDDTVSADELCLLTWRLPLQPARNCECTAERLPMHRRLYLDYEGPVSGNRGVVRQVASAFFRPICWDDAAGVFKLELSESEFGDRLTLIRGSDDRWTCRFSDRDP